MMLRLRSRLVLHLFACVVLGLALAGHALAGNLSNEASPYLKSHADDPIHWHPWGQDALDLAAREDKLIFLSIGYSSCHWCHRMAQDTFSDARVVEVLNAKYVSVLVDREERPDVDGHYMMAMRAMTGGSGWPGNFVLTADGVPLFAVGYVTPEPERGSPGLLVVLHAIVKEWKENRAAVLKDIEITRTQLKLLFQRVPSGVAKGTVDARENAAKLWAGTLDETYGGFGNSAKFLLPNALSLLLDHGVVTRNEHVLENVYKTLDHMAAGGVRDQLGGAFHRYAVDRFWQVPHFEIMLIDNALMARLYLEAFQASKKPLYGAVAREILDDLLARFQLPGGGFASALDSDSAGREGLFYTWTTEEVRSVLGPEVAEPFIKTYVDAKHGLVEGRSVLRLVEGPQSQQAVRKRFADQLLRLAKARAKRVAPKRDVKVLISWNALTVSAFAKAAQVLDDKRYRKVASELMAHLLATSATPGELRHSHLEGKASKAVFLDDYAFLVQALLDVYETEFKVEYLDLASSYMKVLIQKFQSESGKPFRFAPRDLVSNVPHQVMLDEAGVPSGNAAALTALNRLVLYGSDAGFKSQARSIFQGLALYLERSAESAPGLVSALRYRPSAAHEIVIVGEINDPDTRNLLKEVYSRPLRGTVLSVIAPGAREHNDKWPLLSGRPLLKDKPTAFVCRQRLCDLPVDTPSQLGLRLDKLVRP